MANNVALSLRVRPTHTHTYELTDLMCCTFKIVRLREVNYVHSMSARAPIAKTSLADVRRFRFGPIGFGPTVWPIGALSWSVPPPIGQFSLLPNRFPPAQNPLHT